MNAAIAVVLVLAVAVNGGVYTATQQIHGVAVNAPLLHAAQTPILAPVAVHTSSSSSYKIRAPAAKFVAVGGPSLPLVHAMSHPILIH